MKNHGLSLALCPDDAKQEDKTRWWWDEFGVV